MESRFRVDGDFLGFVFDDFSPFIRVLREISVEDSMFKSRVRVATCFLFLVSTNSLADAPVAVNSWKNSRSLFKIGNKITKCRLYPFGQKTFENREPLYKILIMTHSEVRVTID